MRARSVLAFFLLAFCAHCALGQSNDSADRSGLELALSNDTMQVRYLTSGSAIDVERSRIAAAFFLSEERDIVLSGGLLFPADLDLGPVALQFGPQVYAALLDEENDDVLAMSVGTEVRFLINRSSQLAVVGSAYYAPDILTFGAGDNMTDLGARAEIRLAPRLTGFAGMRWFEFDLTDGSGERTLQEEVFVGVGWRF